MAQREQDTLEGVIESIVYKNEENGYTIASVLLDDGGMTTILGSLPFLGAGEHISATGSYSIHPQHGPQFQVESYYREMPEEEEGIYAYLASRVIRGVGPKTAGLIVSRFGRDSFRVLAEEPEKLACVKGITLARAREIQQEFLRLNAMRVLLEFLAEYRLPSRFAAGLAAAYGDRAAEVLRENPYLLCEEPYLLPFQEADTLAARLGIGEDSDLRLEAGILYVLSFNLQAGHTFLPEDRLIDAACGLLEREESWLRPHLLALEEKEKLVRDSRKGRSIVYLSAVYRRRRPAWPMRRSSGRPSACPFPRGSR